MERKLKERITGAVILVVAAIIVIPSILDGDVRDTERTEVLTMPPPSTLIIPTGDDERVIVTAEDAARVPRLAAPVERPTAAPVQPDNDATTATRQSDPPAPVARREVVPAVTEPPVEQQAKSAPEPAPTTAAPVEVPASMAAKPAPRPEPAQPVARPARSDPASGWAVQVGSFASQANADRLAAALTELDYKAFVSRKRLDGRVLYRVRVGPRATRDEALELASRLKKDRQAVAVVPHPG